jgi:LysR family transcriptional regulator, glycine cleavage system transcriptional activator
MTPLPNLSALRAFEAAARHESFTRAASELGLTPAAISRHVRNLEEELGFELFDRLHKAVALTEAGARYAERVTNGFALIAAVPSSPTRPRVKLDIDADLLRLWVLPRLTKDVLDQLGMDIDFHARSDRPRTLPADTEVAVSWGALDYDGFSGRKLLSPRVFPVASDGLKIKSMHEIGGARLLHDRDETWWRAIFEAAGIDYPSRVEALTFDRCDLPIEAARAGLGIAVGDDVIAEDHLKTGALVRIAGPVLESRDYYLLQRKPRLSAHAKRLADWLVVEAKAFTEWQSGIR